MIEEIKKLQDEISEYEELRYDLVTELTNYEEGDEKYEEISDAINEIDIRIIMLKEEIEELEIYRMNKEE
jgi:hypothetical protein